MTDFTPAPGVSCLYSLTFPNGKEYVGISVNPKKRWESHKRLARHGAHWPLSTAIRKYGWGNVVKKVLVVGKTTYIKALEVSVIAAFKLLDRKFGYNETRGGDFTPMSHPEIVQRMRKHFWAPGERHEARARRATLPKSVQEREALRRKKQSETTRGRKRDPEVAARSRLGLIDNWRRKKEQGLTIRERVARAVADHLAIVGEMTNKQIFELVEALGIDAAPNARDKDAQIVSILHKVPHHLARDRAARVWRLAPPRETLT